MTVNDSYIVSFDNEEHKRYVELLQEYGFDIVVTANLKVGLRFIHPLKGHVVRLDEDVGAPEGEVYEPHLFIFVRPANVPTGLPEAQPMQAYDTPMHPEHYSDVEWEWLQEKKASDFELLRRELHIWFKVRPRSMNTMKMVPPD